VELPDTRVVDSLSADEARRIVVRAQGLDRPPAAEGSVEAMLQRLGAVQLDTISVLARSHELVAYARLGPVPRSAVEQAYWAEPARTFEYIGHAACIMPLDLWPYFAFRRQAMRERRPPVERRTPAPIFDEVLARLRDGPVNTTDLGGARENGSGWWDWSAAKVAVEELYLRGEVTVTLRRGWRRIYDLPERVLPPELLAWEPSDEECYAHLVALSARALGVGTVRDIADYFRLTTAWSGSAPNARRLVAESIEAAGLVPVRVEGWREPAFADPEAMAALPAPATRTALVSPFDSLIWAINQAGESKERERMRRVFDFSYSFEAYVPAAQRVHGYFVMPLLANGRLAGRVDPKREGNTLIAATVSLERAEHLPYMAAALREAAAWVGCNSIHIERVLPTPLTDSLRRLVS
jgi:uncharacterized protein YcaQ